MKELMGLHILKKETIKKLWLQWNYEMKQNKIMLC